MKKEFLIKIKRFFKKLPKILANYSFFTFLILLSFFLILGTILWYKYLIPFQKEKPKIKESSLYFQKEKLREILRLKSEREINFERIEFFPLKNPFLPL